MPVEHVRLYAANRGFRTCLVRRGAMTAEQRAAREGWERLREAREAWAAEKAGFEALLVPITEAVAAERERIAAAVLSVIHA